MNVMLLAAVAVCVGGVATVAAGVTRRRVAGDAAAYLRELDLDDLSGEAEDEFTKRMRQPFLSRVLRPVGSTVAGWVTSLTPGNYLAQVHHKLLLAGLSSSVRSEEFVAGQAAATAGGLLVAVLGVTLLSLDTSKATLILVLFPAVGFLAPASWLNRKVGERQAAILKDLPDVVDLLAISVEAGVGFEGALAVVCEHFDSALAEELSRTLKEMELGLPRREALQNLKRRTEVPDLSNFVLALTQADSLGMPLGRILHTQAREMRSRRRARARETAGKLPVKILFPLVAFIFPAVLVIVLGPAMGAIMKAF
ncbi:MAG TPA: type II secretion system F family protein [Acidimicrobiales bacterium]|nr:type II secretion system F family protein [Acidimicrobiales bacterium]